MFRYVAVDKGKELHYPDYEGGPALLSRRGYNREPD